MESLPFPMGLFGLGLVTGVAMRAMITAPSGGHARRLLTTTGLLHEVDVRRHTSQADQPARGCLLTLFNMQLLTLQAAQGRAGRLPEVISERVSIIALHRVPRDLAVAKVI